MLLIRLVLPFLFFLVSVFAYGLIFKKSLINSMAPTFFIQVFVLMFFSMVFDSFSLGIVFILVLSLMIIFANVVIARSFFNLMETIKELNKNCEIFLFIFIYFFVFVINYGKYFSDWDEFTHWGLFVKETYRLDTLFYKSPYWMVHKDYVPAITVFETLYCKLSMRYSEADCYRGIQLLQMSMMLPIIVSSSSTRRDDDSKKNIILFVAKFFIVLAIPLLFSTPRFYHTIYQDLTFGLLIFYSMWNVFVEKIGRYKQFVVSLGLSMLVLSKMVAMAFLPMILFFYILYEVLFEKKRFSYRIVSYIIVASVPIIMWIGCNKYIDIFVPNTGNAQSYDGISFNSLIDILNRRYVIYQNVVETEFFKAIWNRAIIGKIGYATIIIILGVTLLLASRLTRKKDEKKLLFINLSMIIIGIIYGTLMCVVYLTSFSEYEATTLASFERYMGTYVISAVFITFGAISFFSTEIIDKGIVVFSFMMLQNLVFYINVSQIYPGTCTGDKMLYEGETNLIIDNLSESESVCVIMRGDDFTAVTAMDYYCFPRDIKMLRPCKKCSKEDIWSTELNMDEFVAYIGNYDYIYFMNIDETFINEYASLFSNSSDVCVGKLCRVTVENNRINTQWVEKE